MRIALGARPAQVRRMVLVTGLVPAVVGLVVVLAGALAAGGVLSAITFGISPRDPMVLTTVAGVLAAVVLAAGWIPARRATRVDPLRSMRRG